MLNDIRYAARTLIRRPGFTLAAGLTLALGIGANAAVFSVVESVLLRPLPYPDSERLLIVRSVRADLPFVNTVFPYARAMAWKADARSFSSMAFHTGSGMTLTGDGEAARLRVTRAGRDFFQVFGMRPQLGTTLDEQQEREGQVAVLSYRLWRSRYAGAPDIVGRSVRLDGRPYTVVGVMPAAFTFPAAADGWIPLVLTREEADARRAFLAVVGRLRDGVRLEDADRELEQVAPASGNDGRAAGRTTATPVARIQTATLLEQEVGSTRTKLLLLTGAVGLVLLIASVNVANLLLASAVSRRGEMAVRAALGAGRGRLLRQLLTESVLLSTVGGWLGMLLAVWLVRATVTLAPADLRRLDDISVAPLALAFASVISVGTGLLAGLMPSLQSLRASVADGLRGTRRGVAVAGSQRTQRVLVAIQMALTVLLLAGGLLLVKSLIKLTSVNPGLSTDGVLAFEISLPAARYPTAVQQQRAVEEILAGIRAVGAVESAGAALAPPFSGWNFASRIDPLDAPARHASPLYQSVTGGYFQTLGIALEGGRYLRDSDGASAPRAAVISRSLARELWPSSDPVGQRFRIAGGEVEPAWEVVGVVSDVLHSGLSSKPAPALYLPAEQRPSAFMTFLVKSRRDPIALASAIRTRASNVDPDLPLQNMTTMKQRVERTTAQARFYTLALGTFAGVAAVLAIVGVYGLVAYFVGQHLHDLGIHVALGATSRHVVSLVLGTGLRPVAIGLLAGLGAALVLTRTMRELLFEVSPTDPGLLAAAAAVLLVAAFCACVLPARRAAGIDPACALRAE